MPRRPFRLTTDRLTIRLLAPEDVTAFTKYRQLAEVARYQDWPMPYTRDLAHQLVDEMAQLGGPTPGDWVQLGLDDAGVLVGDVAVWLDEAGTLAMLGYTIDPAHQGRGYAVEAVDAMIPWLFRRKRVHRIAATIDPRNLASARVLERCGFDYDGTARSAALVRDEWTDDARFSLLEPDWRSWRSRPTGPPQVVELVEIDEDNVRSVLGVEPTFSQRRLVAPVGTSLAEALVPPVVRGEPVRPWYRAIGADGVIVGFVMVAEPHDGSPDPTLWRLTIDRRHQGRGIGRRVIEHVVTDRRAEGHCRLRVSYVPDGAGSPAGFYARLGFVPTGEADGDEVTAVLDL